MEKYFIIKENSPRYKEYQDYQESCKVVQKAFKDISSEFGFETGTFVPNSKSLGIVPTRNDEKNFESQFTQERRDHRVRMFKQNSRVGKAWKALNLSALHKPFVPFFFKNSGCHNTTNLFMLDNVLYCYIDNGCEVGVETPEDFIEIKGSEYHKIIEEIISYHLI